MAEQNLSNITDDDLISELNRRVGKGNILGVKIWTAEDINLLPENGFDIRTFSKAELESIASSSDMDCLSECTDSDWDGLYVAVTSYCNAMNISYRPKGRRHR